MKAFNRNTIREIRSSRSRFLSILLICFIGVGFFSGVRATCGDMEASADKYYDSQNLFDLRIVSTFGLTEDDVTAIEDALPEDCTAFASKYTDLAVDSGENEYLARVYSALPDGINTPVITEGRNIENSGECLINSNILHKGLDVGGTVTLADLTGAEDFPLKYTEYTVVGLYNSPMYISLSQRGSTTVGDGTLDALMIVPEEDFTQEYYTEIYVKSDTLAAMSSYSDEYDDYRETLSEILAEIGVERSNIRYDEVLGEAQREISDGESDLARARLDGQQELDDAKRELDDALIGIEDAEKELADAKAVLDDAEVQLADAEKQLADALLQLNDAKAQLTAAKQALDESGTQLDEAQAQIDEQRQALDEGKAALEAAKEQYESGLAQYNSAVEQFNENERQIIAAEQIYGAEAVAAQRAELEAARTALAQQEAELSAASAQISDNEAALAEAQEQLDAAQQTVSENSELYRQALAEYEANAALIAESESEYNVGLAEFAANKADFEQGAAEYEDGAAQLADAREQYESGLAEYNEGVAEFVTEIADAEQELADAREKIADAGNAEWYIFTRDDNAGYTEYGSNAQRIDRIALIFPIFFLIVAGLVCLTTMSRMVEEQRTQIGTLKALGYGNGSIMRHYMIYAVSGAVLGGTTGAYFGCVLFPTVIMYAYSIMYTITDFTYLFEPWNMIFSIGSMTAAIALTVFFSCRKILKETPASLMRPKAPKSGKRVVIERITFLWNRMSFFAKVSARNLFRYKRRMFMTIIGIAGCTALSLTGFGLKDSISDIVGLQYLEINNYSGFLAYDADAEQSELDEIFGGIEDFNPDSEYMRALIKQYDTVYGDNTVSCYVTCAEDAERFSDFINLRERVSQTALSLTDGAVITEKAAKLLGITTGDEISVRISDGEYKSVKIAGITEQYTSHYLYLSADLYEECFGCDPEYNIIYFKNGISSEGADADEFSARMLKFDSVLSVSINAASMSVINDTLGIMDLVVVVLIVAAGALAAVVLYNLSNVNITERIREIATLKVLGFYDGEVSMYVFRENIVLTLMGALLGLGLGTALCMFVIETAELDELMFGRSIHPLSYLLSFLVTVVFSFLINLIMSGVLKKISMVESLKSVE